MTHIYDYNTDCACLKPCASEEESGYEEAAYHSGSKGAQEAHAEEGLLVQLLSGEEGSGENAISLSSVIPLCKAGIEGPCADDATMRLSRSMCVAGAIMAFACKNGDEKYRTSYDDPPVQRSSYGREAEKAEEDGEDGEETVEIICAIFCP
jgi:hypothetical protein